MPYKIVINRIEKEQVEERGEWRVIDKRPWTAAELSDAAPFAQTESFAAKNPLKEICGYTPSRTVTREIDVKVLEQTVETLDIAAVIKAINGLA